MKVIGLVGGIACGKSFIADALERLGAGRFDGDRAGHQTLCEPQVKQAVQELWGDEILDQKGEVIRRKLAEIVFAPAPNGPRELKRLEELVHPRIASALDLLLTELRTAGECPAVVVDAALLMEAGWDAQCDEVWFIDVPRETRLRRAKTRGWTEEEFSAREDAQLPLHLKRRRADRIINNPDANQDVSSQVTLLFNSLIHSS